MGIFDKFLSRDELLMNVSEMVQVLPGKEGEPELYYLEEQEGGKDEELVKQVEKERSNALEFEKKWKEAEAALQSAREENARLAATNEEYSKFNPEKQRNEINRLLEEVGRLKADNKGLNDQIAPLSQMIADYKSKEDERMIEKALIDEAARLGVRPEAMRDVMFRKSLLQVSDLGTVQTKEGVNVAEFLKSEFEVSPLWHPVCQEGGSLPGKTERVPSSELYRDAVQKKDFEGMIVNAPEFKGVTLS